MARKKFKNRKTLSLLEAIQLPGEVSIIHCKKHQKENHPPDAQGIGTADLATWKAAPIASVRPLPILVIMPEPELPKTQSTHKKPSRPKGKVPNRGNGWWFLPGERPVLHYQKIAKHHKATHLGTVKSDELFRPRYSRLKKKILDLSFSSPWGPTVVCPSGKKFP